MNQSERRRRNRRKKKIIAYSMRILTACVAVTMIFLMVCGVLYIREHFTKGGEVQAAVASGDAAMADESPGKFVVILDAGHGGKDNGTRSGDVLEKDVNLKVAQEMKAVLESRGATVVMTREDDTFVSLSNRAEISNSNSGDLFVSVHCNYYDKDASIKGLECYYASGSDKGKAYAQSMVDAVEAGDIEASRGIKTNNYYVLRNTEIPAVLVELGYLSNQTDCANLTDESFQKKLAKELTDGIAF